MKLKIIVLITLVFGIVFGQEITDTTNVATETNDKFEQSLNAEKPDVKKLNKTVSTLDSLIKTNQSFTSEKIGQLENSITAQVKSLEDLIKSVNRYETNSNLHFNELEQMIGSITDNLLTNENSILRIKQQNSFNEAFLMERLKPGPNQKFEGNGNVYKTDYDNEMTASPIVIAIDSLKFNLDKKAKELDNEIVKANTQITDLNNYMKKVNSESKIEMELLDKTIIDRTLYLIIATLIVLVIIIFVFFFLKSKVTQQQDSLSSVKDTQKKLELESLKLDEKTIDLIENQLTVLNLQETTEVDHTLPLKVGEEIHRMRKRLKTMEESQDTKVLKKRIESLEDKINDMGYKIVNLEGQTFNEGMTVEARFIPDENLKDGEEIITRVIKPQINYKDTLIQAAQVEVAQGG
jgi:HAMP domain-containing protein